MRSHLCPGLDPLSAVKFGSGPWKGTACIRSLVTPRLYTVFLCFPMATSCQVARTALYASGEVRPFPLSPFSHTLTANTAANRWRVRPDLGSPSDLRMDRVNDAKW